MRALGMGCSMSTQNPPMDPSSSEADAVQLDLARKQGAAYRAALNHMAENVAHDGGMQPADQYLVAYAIEEAEGMYMVEDGELVWHDPEEENLHVEIAVCDASDGRFVPGLKVTGTLIDPRRRGGRLPRPRPALASDDLPLRAQLEGPAATATTRCA